MLYANPVFAQLAGRTAPLLHGMRFQGLLSPGGAMFYETQFAPSLLLRGSLTEISFDLIRPDGEIQPIFINAVLRPTQSGQPAHMLIAAFGARQRRLYENELLRARKQSEQIAEVVRRSSDAIIRLTPDGIIQTWNNGAQHIFGYSAQEVIGRPLTSFFVEDGQAAMETAIAQLTLGSEVLADAVAVHKAGRAIEVSVSLTPHLEAPGTLVAFSAVIRDITDRKLAERALLQTEKLASVGRLASSIAHEINNPLEAVTNLLYILETHVLTAENRQLVVTAQEELARVSQIATHTLRFHKQSTARTEVNIRSLVDSVLALYRARLQNSGIRTVNQSSQRTELLCYEGEIRQVLVNLISNAFDAMRHGGTLTVRSSTGTLWPSGSPGIRITVADTGTGIDTLDMQRIFEPFFSTKGLAGTGLGLWITKDLVVKNGGWMKVRSCTRPERTGTVVTLTFPQAH